MDNNLLYLDAKVTGSNNYITLFSGSSAISSSIIYQSGGNIGIGTTNPYTLFNVVGITTIGYPGVSSNSHLQFWPREAGGNAYYITDSGSVLRIGTGDKAISGADVLNISALNVGIGTDNPQAKFVISNNGAQGMEFGYSAILNSNYIESFNRATELPTDMAYYLGPGTGSHKFYTNGGQRMVINKDGAVGINNAAPVAALDVIGTTIMRGGDLIISSSYPRLYLTDTDSNSDFSIINDNGALNIYDDTNGASRIYISSSGNVGIGTTSPSYKLSSHDTSAGRVTVGNFSNDANEGSTEVGIRLAHNNADVCSVNLVSQRVGPDAGADFSIETANSSGVPTERFRITEGGNVGIGTTSPTNARLSVVATDAIAVKVESSYTTSGQTYSSIHVGALANNQGAGIGFVRNNATAANSFLHITPYGSTEGDVFAIRPNGNVGLGTSTPTSQLQLSLNSAAKPTSGTWTITSDVRVKENIKPYVKGLKELTQINPVTYDYNGKAGFSKIKNNIGIIAQDIKDILPETISTYQTKLNNTDAQTTTLYNFDAHALTFVLINSIKEQQVQIETLQQQVNTLISGSK
jgi:hypothetical protein